MAGALEVSHTRMVNPMKKKIVRWTGQVSPRSASLRIARMYQMARKIVTATHSQLKRHSVIQRIAVNSGGSSYFVVMRAGEASGGTSSGFGGSELPSRVAVTITPTIMTTSTAIRRHNVLRAFAGGWVVPVFNRGMTRTRWAKPIRPNAIVRTNLSNTIWP